MRAGYQGDQRTAAVESKLFCHPDMRTNLQLKTRRVKTNGAATAATARYGRGKTRGRGARAPLETDLQRLKEKLVGQGVKYCLGAYVDIHGVPKGKFVPIEHFE